MTTPQDVLFIFLEKELLHHSVKCTKVNAYPIYLLLQLNEDEWPSGISLFVFQDAAQNVRTSGPNKVYCSSHVD
jgi:hypothetical protein